jgi:regulator of Ty1 transposition protein 109
MASANGTMPPSPPPLSHILSSSLPTSHPHKYAAHYLLSPPAQHPSLFLSQPLEALPDDPQSDLPDQSDTTCQHHLLLVSHAQKFIYALEILIYRFQSGPPIIYVSKADTTGLSPASITRPITTAFLRYLLQLTGGGTVQLFARSQGQYIFPGSAYNGRKHILDDPALIKWWLRVLSPLNVNGQGRVYIPGVDAHKIRSYFPEGEEWECKPPGYTTEEVSRTVLAREVVPVFPDDPKARFLGDLDDDEQLPVTTLDQFWAMMEHRQECSSGHLVGFISISRPMGEVPEGPGENGVVLSEEEFNEVFDRLLEEGDFESEEVAVVETEKWLEGVNKVVPEEKRGKWGFEIVPCGVEGGEVVGRKRAAEEVKPVNQLGGMLVRKKPKK